MTEDLKGLHGASGISESGHAFSVGADLVWEREDGSLAVYSSRRMDGWRAGKYRQTVVVFRGRSFKLAEVRLLGPQRVRYLLTPWAPGGSDLPGLVVHYGEEYVSGREETARYDRRAGLEGFFLFFLTPVLGFLGSRMKIALETRYGFDPLRLTSWSLVVQIFLLIVGLLFSLGPVFALAQGKLGIELPAWGETAYNLFLLFLLLDLVIRMGKRVEGERFQYGLGEWLLWAFRRRPAAAPERRAAPPAPVDGADAVQPGPAPEEPESTVSRLPVSPESTDAAAGPGEAVPVLRQVGKDLVEMGDDWLRILCHSPMAGWHATKYRKLRVLFADRAWQIDQVTQGAKGVTVYRLSPWPETESDPLSEEVRYGEELVEEREQDRRSRALRERISWGMYFTAMFWGFGWSTFKLRMESTWNVDPRDATRYSLLIQAGLGLLALVWAVMNQLLGRLSPFVAGGIDWGLVGMVVIWPDALVRWLRLCEGGLVQWGFYEWLLRRRPPRGQPR